MEDVVKKPKNIKAKNGLYFATGVGVEYKNVTAEVLGAYIDGSIDVKDKNNIIHRYYSDFKIMTNIGYKF